MNATEHPDNVLYEWYERYIGEPDAETDVYLGFGLFFTGIAFAAIGLILFILAASVYGLRTDGYYALAQPAYFLGMLSVPIVFLAIVVLLPTQSRVVRGAFLGTCITLIAGIALLWYYPGQWFEFGTQQTLLVVGTYAIGLAIVAAAAGAGLVGHHLERRRAPAPSDIQPKKEEPRKTVTDEQVRADIEEAMADIELTWGGVAKKEHRRLELTSDYSDEAMGEVEIEASRVVSPGGVDAEVEGLRQLQGGMEKTATLKSTVDEQTAALNELKQQKVNDEVPADAPVASRSFLSRVLTRLGLR